MTLEAPSFTSATTSLDRVFEALDRGGYKPEKRSNSFKALCPIHGDAKQSLSVKYDSSAGKILFHCFGCDAPAGEIAAALGLTMSDLFDAPLPDKPGRQNRTPRPSRPKLPPRITREETAPKGPDLSGAEWRETKVYPYPDADGVVVQRVHRREAIVDGVRHKEFHQTYRGANGNWVKNKTKAYEPLFYNLPAVLETVAAGGDVWLLEGEKDADSAISEGLTGTTNAGGAISEKQLPTEMLAQLRGAIVRIVADNDAAGAKRVVYLSTKFTELDITHHIYLPNLTDRKSDFTDHLDAGGTLDTLIEISIDDARTMVAAAESERLVDGPTGVAICLKEATAQLESTQQDRGTAEQHAEAWARESLIRFEKIRYAAPIVANEADLTARGRQALESYAETLREGAQIAADTYRTAGLDIPKAISLALAAIAATITEADEEEPAAKDGPGQAHVVGAGGGGNGVFFGNAESEDRPGKGIRIIGSEYRVVEGETVLVKTVPGDSDAEGKQTFIEKYYRVMRGWAEVDTVAVEDDGTEDDFARAPHMIAIRFFRWLRDEHGKPLRDKETREVLTESVLLKYNEDQLRDGSWAQALPWPGFLETNSRRGRDQAWDAIFSARQTVNARSIVHTTVGWRNADTGPYFVHAAGAIAKGGMLDTAVDVDKTSSIYAMPEPTTDRETLRQAWIDGTIALKESELPARVIAPLLGHAWTAPVLPGPIILHLVGGFASYKSSHSRLPVQYYAPDLTYMTKGLISGAASGATAIALPRLLSTINHVPVIVDDFAPDGDAKGAIRRISALGRTIFNGSGRLRARQRKGTEADRPILASVITSGELSAQGSADSRIVNLPLDPATVVNGGEIFARLESKKNRHARATIGSALVHWIADRRDDLIAEFTEASEDLEHRLSTAMFWRGKIPKIVGHNGLHDRLVQSASVLDRGIVVMLMMLRELDVISKAEADEFYAWAREGIFEAMNLQDSAASDPAEQLLDYLREAIANGSAHLAGFDGVHPDDPSGMGWVDQSNGTEPMWRANGQRLGIINPEGNRVYLFPGTAIGIANSMSQRADEAFSETKVSIASSLQSHGWLDVDSAGKRSVNRRIGRTMQQRVWDIPLSALLNNGEGGDGPAASDDTTGGDTPDGGVPTLFDDPIDDQPYTDPAQPEPAPEPTPEQPTAPSAPVPAAAGAETRAPSAPAVDVQPADDAPKARPTYSYGSFRAPLGVLHTDGLWLPDGELVQIKGQLQHAGQLAQLATDLNLGTQINSGANKLRKTERGQIFLTAAAAAALGLTLPEIDPRDSDYPQMLKDATTGAEFITAAIGAGYSLTGDGAMASSIDVWREDDRTAGVHIGLIPAQNDAFIRTILSEVTDPETGETREPEPATIARRLGRFAEAMRFPYRHSAATTGIKLMTATHVKDDHEKLFHPVAKPPVLREAGYAEDDFNWQRQLTADEREHTWVHAFDRGGSYLAAVAGLEFGIGSPTHHTGPLTFVPDSKKPGFNRLPGYWNITAPEMDSWLVPYLFTPNGRFGPAIAGTQIWIATPVMELAHELGIELQIHEAWLWQEKGRVLDSWYKRMREARETLDTGDDNDRAARDLVKSTYVASIGMLDYRGRHDQLAIWAPHRHDHIVAKSRANILRRILKIGEETNRWPVAIEKDAILYTSDTTEAAEAWPGDPMNFGRGLGQFKYEASAPLAEHVEFLTGSGPYRGKSHMQELI